MSYSLYDSFSCEEAGNIGARFRVKARGTRNYEHVLTTGKEYEIEITPRILPMSPLCKGVGNDGEPFECHLHRFEKIEELKDV